MTVTIPGKPANTTPQAKKVKAEFPQCVYGESLEDVKTINSLEEMPDGYCTYDDFVGNLTSTEDDAKKAYAEAKKAEKEYRAGVMEYLDAHDVDYAKNLSTPKLEVLKVALDEHLEAQGKQDDAE